MDLGLLLFTPIQIMLVGTIFLFVSGSSIWLGTIVTLTSCTIVVSFVLKAEDIYNKVRALCAKGRKSASAQTSLRAMCSMKDKER